MKNLVQKLCKVGLSHLESQVYLGLLERQLTTAGALAKHLDMKRSTVYTVLETLIQKGLCSLTHVEHVKHFQAESPHRLEEWLASEQNKLDERRGVFEGMEKELEKIAEKKIRPPKVSIYEGQAGVESLLMKNLDEEPTEVLAIGEHMEEKDHLEKYTQRRIDMGIPSRVIIPDSDLARRVQKIDEKCHRVTHLVEKKFRFPASIHVYNQSVALFTYNGDDPVGIYIENKDISESMKMIFALLEKDLH